MSRKLQKSLSKITLLLFTSLTLFTSCVQEGHKNNIDPERNMAILSTKDKMVVYVNPTATLFLEIMNFLTLGVLFVMSLGGSFEKTYDVKNTAGRTIAKIHTGRYEHFDGFKFGPVASWFCITAFFMHMLATFSFARSMFFQFFFGGTPIIAFIVSIIASESSLGENNTNVVRNNGIACFIILCILLLASIVHNIWPQSVLGDFIKDTVEVILS